MAFRKRNLIYWALLATIWIALGALFFTQIILPKRELIAFTYENRNIEILRPLFFGLILFIPSLWIAYRFTLSDLPRFQRWINLGLRALILVALSGALSQWVVTTFESRVSTIFLIDTSASIPDSVLNDATKFINEAIAKKGERNEVRVIAFAKRPYEIKLNSDTPLVSIPRPTKIATSNTLTDKNAKDNKNGYGTNPASALQMAYGLFPQDHLKRIVIISDGNETHGDFLAESYKADAFGIRIFNKEIEFKAPKEVLIREMNFPEIINVKEPFPIVLRVFSNHKIKANFQLWQNDFKDAFISKELEPGMNEIELKSEVFEPGFKKFKLNMKVEGADHFKDNNTFVYSTNVEGKPRVLYIEGYSRARHYLERALKTERFDLETRGKFGIPNSLAELENFDCVIISDLAAMYFSQGQMQVMDRYVRELGGGLIMVGGENSFGPGGYYGSYIERTLPVYFKPKKRRKTPTLALMLVIDKSGSMSGERIELVKEAAKSTIEILQSQDRVGVLAFDDGTMPLVRMQSARNKVRIISNISRLSASGGTNIAGALAEAYEELLLTSARIKHIILLSDGASDTANIFSELIPALRIEGITVSTVAVGGGTDTTLLRRMAQGGKGRYYYARDPYSIPRIFMKETSTVSRSSMVEEPFRPKIKKRAQFLNGIAWDSAPYLLGYVSTALKPHAALIMATEYGEPLVARWRRGLGKVVVFTSDLKNRWAVEWLRWSGYQKFWSQLLRDTMRSNKSTQLAMTTTTIQDKAKIVVDAIGKDDKFINGLISTIAVTAPDGKKSELNLNQTASGRYEALLPMTQFGSYGLKATHELDGDTLAVSLASISNPYPREFQFIEANRELLRRAAQVGGGETDPSIEKLFDPLGEEVKYRKELWPFFLLVALLLLVLDLLFRRVRLGGGTDVSWTDVISGKS